MSFWESEYYLQAIKSIYSDKSKDKVINYKNEETVFEDMKAAGLLNIEQRRTTVRKEAKTNS